MNDDMQNTGILLYLQIDLSSLQIDQWNFIIFTDRPV